MSRYKIHALYFVRDLDLNCLLRDWNYYRSHHET